MDTKRVFICFGASTVKADLKRKLVLQLLTSPWTKFTSQLNAVPAAKASD
jgi:hypothetical protein